MRQALSSLRSVNPPQCPQASSFQTSLGVIDSFVRLSRPGSWLAFIMLRGGGASWMVYC